MKKTLLSLVIITGILGALYVPSTAHACSCIAVVYTEEQKLENAGAVFLGIVTKIETTENVNTVTFSATKSWKGAVQMTQTLTTPKDSAGCGFNFEMDKEYLVYTNKQEGKYSVNLCGSTNLSSNSAESLTFLGEGKTPSGKSMFVKNLGVGSRGEEVRMLQQFLNTNGYIVTTTGPGSKGMETTYFGQATKNALMKFQEAKKIELGIKQGTGYFGQLTRALLNK